MAEQPNANILTAPCPVCGTTRFEAPGSAPGPEDILTCQSCGTKLSYAFLQSRMPPAEAPKARKAKRTARKARRK